MLKKSEFWKLIYIFSMHEDLEKKNACYFPVLVELEKKVKGGPSWWHFLEK